MFSLSEARAELADALNIPNTGSLSNFNKKVLEVLPKALKDAQSQRTLKDLSARLAVYFMSIYNTKQLDKLPLEHQVKLAELWPMGYRYLLRMFRINFSTEVSVDSLKSYASHFPSNAFISGDALKIYLKAYDLDTTRTYIYHVYRIHKLLGRKLLK